MGKQTAATAVAPVEKNVTNGQAPQAQAQEPAPQSQVEPQEQAQEPQEQAQEPQAQAQEPQEPQAEVYVSEKLTALRNEEDSLDDKYRTSVKGSPEAKALKLKLWDIGIEIDNEINAIKAAKIALEKELAEKKIVADFMAIFPLHNEFRAAEAAFEAVPVVDRDLPVNAEIKALYIDLKTRFNNVTEPIINRLLGSVPKKATTGTGTAANKGTGKGTLKEQIQEIIAPLYATMSGEQIRAYVIKELKYNDGTANGAIVEYEKANSLNGKKPD